MRLRCIDDRPADCTLRASHRPASAVSLSRMPASRLDDLRQRPERDALAVGKRATLPPATSSISSSTVREELGDEAALADPRHSDQRHQLRRALLTHAPERRDEQLELPAAADERAVALRETSTPKLERACRPPRHGSALLLPLPTTGSRIAVVDRVRGRAVGLFADQHAVQRRSRFQTRRGVDHVTRRPSTRPRSAVRRA